MIRWSARIFFGLIAVLLVLFIFLVTPAGFHASLNLVKKALPGELTYTKISGNIFSPIDVNNLVYKNESIYLRIQKAHIEWHAPMLLLKHISISDLTASGVNLQFKDDTAHTQSAPQTSSSQPQELNLPFSLKIKHAAIRSANLINNQGKKEATIESFDIQNLILTDGKVDGRATIAFSKPYPITSQLDLSGKLDNYKIHWVIAKTNNKLILTGQGNLRSINVSLDGSEVSQGSASGNAKIQWYPHLAWQANLNIKNLDLKKFYAGLPTINYAKLQSKGEWKQKTPDFTINATLSTPQTHLSLNGKHKGKWALKYIFDSDNLAEFSKHYLGKLKSQGDITGSNTKPTITGKLFGSDLIIKDMEARSIKGEFNLDFSYLSNSNIQLTGNGIKLPLFNAVTAKLKATTSKHFEDININLQSTDKSGQATNLKISLAGIIKNKLWQGKLSQLTLSSAETGVWRLIQAAPLSFSQEKISLQLACLHSLHGNACTHLNWGANQPWEFSSKGKLVRLDLLTGILFKHFKVKANTEYQIKISGDANKIKKIHANLKINKGGSLTYTKDFQIITSPINYANIQINSKQTDLISQINIRLAKNDTLNSQMKLPNFLTKLRTHQLKDAPINGTLNFTFSRMKVLQIFFPTILQPKGVLTGNLTLSGTLPLPNINGKVSVKGGYVEIPIVQVKLTNINAEISAKNKKLFYTITAQTLKSPIKITGTTEYQNDKFISTFNIIGNNILVANTHQYYITTSPNLTIKTVGTGLVVTGSILIPKATLRPVTFSRATTLPDDAVIITRKDTSGVNTYNYILNITIKLGKDVKINSRGLKSYLGGELKITRNVNQPEAIATGQINLINASFALQGKVLTITKGSNINYIHDVLSNPHLSLTASHNVSIIATQSGFQLSPTKTEVGVNIKGTLKRPKVSLFSSPIKLSQADILSYLLFDSPSSGSSPANLSTVLNAATHLNLTPGKQDSSISSIKQKLGITELGVQQQTYVDALGTPLGINQSSFVIGSYITPKIYVRYNHGLLTNVDIYQVRYIINKNWAIQTETGAGVQGVGTGVDILYTISRKRFPW